MTGQTAEYCEDRNSPYRCLLSPSLTLSLPPPSPGLNCKTYRNTMSGFTPYPRKSLEQPLPAVNRGKSSFSLTVLSPPRSSLSREGPDLYETLLPSTSKHSRNASASSASKSPLSRTSLWLTHLLDRETATASSAEMPDPEQHRQRRYQPYRPERSKLSSHSNSPSPF